jgi:hypothetical protein
VIPLELNVAGVTRARHPGNARAQTMIEVALVEFAHLPDAKFIVLAHQFHLPPLRRVQTHVPDRGTKTVGWYFKIFERATNKYAGGMDRCVERFFAVDKQDTQAGVGEQSRALQAGQPGADDCYVIFHDRDCECSKA